MYHILSVFWPKSKKLKAQYNFPNWSVIFQSSHPLTCALLIPRVMLSHECGQYSDNGPSHSMLERRGINCPPGTYQTTVVISSFKRELNQFYFLQFLTNHVYTTFYNFPQHSRWSPPLPSFSPFWTTVWRMWWRKTSGDGDWPQASTCMRLRDTTTTDRALW